MWESHGSCLGHPIMGQSGAVIEIVMSWFTLFPKPCVVAWKDSWLGEESGTEDWLARRGKTDKAHARRVGSTFFCFGGSSFFSQCIVDGTRFPRRLAPAHV